MNKIGLALSGGGILGAYQAGLLYEFSKEKSFKCVSGSSIGAVNACLLYGGSRQKLYDFWQNCGDDLPDSLPSFVKMGTMLFSETKNFSKPRLDFWNILLDGLYILDCSPLIETLKKTVDFEKINTMKEIELYVCATDIELGIEKIFTNEEINIDNVTASFAVPEIFPFKKVGERWYWDGAYTRNPALMPLVENGVEEIWISRLLPEKGKVPTNKDELKLRMNEIGFNTPLRLELSFIKRLNDLSTKVPELKNYYQPVEIKEFPLTEDVEFFSALMADKNYIRNLFEKGQNSARIYLS